MTSEPSALPRPAVKSATSGVFDKRLLQPLISISRNDRAAGYAASLLLNVLDKGSDWGFIRFGRLWSADDLVARLDAYPSDRWSDLIPSIRALYHHWRQAIRRHGRAGVVLERLADAPEGEAGDVVRLTRLK